MTGSPGHTIIMKALTMSDTSFGVSKSGRVVLPRAQASYLCVTYVEGCLEQLLRLGGASSAAASLKANLVPRLSVNLIILDEHNAEFEVALKTWQNVVSGQHRPTFVLENTASFMAAHPMKPGDILAICVTPDSRLQMRTDMRMVEAPAAGIKRKLSNSSYATATAAAAAGTASHATTTTTTTAAVKRGRGSYSLKRNSSMGPSTPAPSSPQQNDKNTTLINGVDPMYEIRYTSADVAAATALMTMSSDTRSSSFYLTTTDTSVGVGKKRTARGTTTVNNKNEDTTTSSGLSGSSPGVATGAGAVAALGESEVSMESQVRLASPNTDNGIYQQQKVIISGQGTTLHNLPPPPLPAPTSLRNHPALISPFQEALLNYSLENVDQLQGRFPSLEHEEQMYHRQQQQQQQMSYTFSTNHQHQHHQTQSSMEPSAAMRPVVQSGATIWPLMMSQAAMVVANAMHNYRLNQQQQEQREQEKTAERMRVLLKNNEHDVAIRNAPSDLPQVSVAPLKVKAVPAVAPKPPMPAGDNVGNFGAKQPRVGPGFASPVEALLRSLVH